MDATAVLMGAIGGGLGALVGSVVGYAVEKRFGGRFGTSFFTIALMVLGVNLGPMAVDTAAGTWIRGAFGTPRELEDAAAELRTQPLFAVMFRIHPELEADFNRTIADAYRGGGREALGGAASEWSSKHVGNLFSELAPYVRDEDLTAWAGAKSELLEGWLEEEPLLCHDIEYGSLTGNPVTGADLSAEDLSKLETFQRNVMAPMFGRADLEISRQPDDGDRAAFASLSRLFVGELGPDRLRFVQGERPVELQDARIVCRAVIGFYSNLADDHRGANAIRVMMSQ